jgi:hypothetical protein
LNEAVYAVNCRWREAGLNNKLLSYIRHISGRKWPFGEIGRRNFSLFSGLQLRNLILITQPGRQDPNDFEEIAERVRKLDRYTKVFVFTPQNTSDDIKREDWRNPTLTVTLGNMGNFRPRRGRFFYNRPISKERQVELFANDGIRTPKTIVYSAGMVLDEREWGHVVVVKTSNLKQTSQGQSAFLVQLNHLNDFSSLADSLKERIISNGVLVQEFVPTGDYPTSYRAGIFLGRAIHMMKKRSNVPIPDLTNASIGELNIDSNHEAPGENNFAARELVIDDEIMTFASRIAKVFPGLPLLGIDIIRHSKSGELFALEINGGGNTWQFSSRHAAPGRLVISKEERVKQFDAWNTCARALVETTRSHAS